MSIQLLCIETLSLIAVLPPRGAESRTPTRIFLRRLYHECPFQLHRELNKAASTQPEQRPAQWVPLLYYTQKALEALPTSEAVVSYRWLADSRIPDGTCRVGDLVCWSAFTATFQEQSVSARLAKCAEPEGVILVAKGQSGKGIRPFSRFGREKAFLFPLNSQFQVTDRLSQQQWKFLCASAIEVLELEELNDRQARAVQLRKLRNQTTHELVAQVTGTLLQDEEAPIDLSVPPEVAECVPRSISWKCIPSPSHFTNGQVSGVLRPRCLG